MEDIVLFEDGQVVFSFKKDGTPCTTDYSSLPDAAEHLLASSKVPSFIITSPTNKKIACQKPKDGALIFYITDVNYPDIAIHRILETQSLMYNSFGEHFLRQIHMEGMNLQTVFQRPRCHAHVERKELQRLLAAVSTACSTPRIAFYCKDMVIEATDEYWIQEMPVIYAIDLVVRNNEAPYTDQRLVMTNGTSTHVCVVQLQNTLKLVCVGEINLSQIIISKLPNALNDNSRYLRSLYPDDTVKLNLRGWIIKDRETPRYFGEIPDNLEEDFVELACKTEEICEKNRVTSVALTLNDYKFFYLPMVLVNQKSVLLGNRPSHVWDFYFIYEDTPRARGRANADDIQGLFNFGIATMQDLVPYLRAVEKNKGREC